LGVDNLLDKSYSEPLGGVNRAMGSDIAVGERLPSAGAGVYLGVNQTW
jgi:iron complex outermembrane receptor protein